MTASLLSPARPRASRVVFLFAFVFIFGSCQEEDHRHNKEDYSTVSTIAGGESSGWVDGIGSMARFKYPCGLVTDREGNLYVSDYGNHTIRKITPRGVVSTYAGTGKAGDANGFRLSASFNHPYGLALDESGNLFVGDVANHRIRMISSDGTVTTLAGKKKGFADRRGSMARFDHPYGVAVDSAGNVYVADSYNNRIRKVSPDGWVTTVAGSGNDGYVDGAGTEAEFYVPVDIALDQQGNIFVGDEGNSSIRKITTDGNVLTLAGNGKFSFADGVGTGATFNAPGAIAIDGAGNLLVADYFNNCIRKVTPSGEVRKIAGSLEKGYLDGRSSEARFFHPFGIAVDPAGTIYVGDQFNHRIRKIN